MNFVAVLVNGASSDDKRPIGQGAIVTADVDTIDEACAWLQKMTEANEYWRAALIVPPAMLDNAMAVLRNDALTHLKAVVTAVDQIRVADAEVAAAPEQPVDENVQAQLQANLLAVADTARAAIPES